MLKKPSLNKRRSKRLMKKLHIGPFQEMGMDLTIKYKEGVTTVRPRDMPSLGVSSLDFPGRFLAAFFLLKWRQKHHFLSKA